MKRTARLLQLMQLLRARPGPITAAELAQDLHVAPRTVHRDIDALRGLGAVIDGAAGFGFTLIEDPALPPMAFAEDELEALVLGLREVSLIGDPDLSKAAIAALRKLQARLPASQSHRLEHAVLTAVRFDRPAAPAISAGALRKACWEERHVAFGYRDGKGAQTARQAKPLGLIYFDRSTVLVAWCLLREDFRLFRLDRMQDLKVQKESFRPERVPLLRRALQKLREDKPPARNRD